MQWSRVEFRRAGAITYNLFDKSLGTEKGVDVKLATDLIVLRDIYDVAIIVSRDQDYVPAVQVIKDSGKIEITSQNHGFCVDLDSLAGKDVQLTHMNLNDNTFEGLRCDKLAAFSVQYHPEASPGPHDSQYLFTHFLRLMGGKAA